MAIVARGAIRLPDGRPSRSPPLEAYLQALELFSETFRPAGGLRLLRIARPAILFYGLYNPSLLENDRVLLELVIIRGFLATAFDNLFPSAGTRSVQPQVLLDMLLMELDRGIDLLAVGPQADDRHGPTAQRAAAYWLIIRVISQVLGGYFTGSNALAGPIASRKDLSDDLLAIAAAYTRQTKALPQLDKAFGNYALLELFPEKGQGDLQTFPPLGQPLPPLNSKALGPVREELQVQRQLEKRWRNLVRTVAPAAGDQETIFELLDLVILQAESEAGLRDAPAQEWPLPPQYEQSLERIAHSI
jgi:hypothetical protein